MEVHYVCQRNRKQFLKLRSQINVLVANKRWIIILWCLAVSPISICFCCCTVCSEH